MKVVFAALLVALFTAAAQACPEVDMSGTELEFSAEELFQAHSFKVVAGGPEDLDRCSLRGANSATGYVAEAPDFELYYTGTRGYALEFRVTSECDSVLLINTGNGNWYFDDDDNGNGDAKIRLTQPSEGWYDIWIGTYDSDTCSAALILETF